MDGEYTNFEQILSHSCLNSTLVIFLFSILFEEKECKVKGHKSVSTRKNERFCLFYLSSIEESSNIYNWLTQAN